MDRSSILSNYAPPFPSHPDIISRMVNHTSKRSRGKVAATVPLCDKFDALGKEVLAHGGRLPDGRYINPVFGKNSSFYLLNAFPINFTWPMKCPDSNEYIFTKCAECRRKRRNILMCRMGSFKSVARRHGIVAFERTPNAKALQEMIGADQSCIMSTPLLHTGSDAPGFVTRRANVGKLVERGRAAGKPCPERDTLTDQLQRRTVEQHVHVVRAG